MSNLYNDFSVQMNNITCTLFADESWSFNIAFCDVTHPLWKASMFGHLTRYRGGPRWAQLTIALVTGLHSLLTNCGRGFHSLSAF